MDTFQVLMYAGLLVMAAITIISTVWAFFLAGELRNRPSPRHYKVEVDSPEVFSKDELAVIGQEARNELHGVVARSASVLETALSSTIAGLTTKTEDMAKVTLTQEFEKYHTSLEALREETIKEFGALQHQLDEKRTELTADLEAQSTKLQVDRMDAFNAKLGDVVSSYLVETLDKGVDLGAQAGYVVKMLEAHKEDIKKDVLL